MLSSQNQPETQPLNLENTPPLLFQDNSDDDESMWGWLHPSSSFNFQPLGNQSLPFTVLPMVYFTSFKSPSFKILVKIIIFYKYDLGEHFLCHCSLFNIQGRIILTKR